MFYEATYNPGFASIFATVDICALIPKDQAHVCILEEPEHLNWMRVVQDKELPSTSTNALTEEAKQSDTVQESNPTTDTSSPPSDTVTTAADATVNKRIEMNQLGWQAKFDFVVGILHTNYDAYVRQYGMGAAFLAASALHALSAMCIRAYCHKVIRLSDTLPALDSSKEVTCNVHGVLSEFLQAPSAVEEEPNDPALASIYFIGKLVRRGRVVVSCGHHFESQSLIHGSPFLLFFLHCRFGPRGLINCWKFKNCTRVRMEPTLPWIFMVLVPTIKQFNERFSDAREF